MKQLFAADVCRKKFMCRFQELYSSELGYVVRCQECQHYQLSFGGIVLTLKQIEYEKFMEVLCFYKDNFFDSGSDSTIPVPTPREGVHLMLDYQKIADLRGMLEDADAEAKALNLLDLFYK